MCVFLLFQILKNSLQNYLQLGFKPTTDGDCFATHFSTFKMINLNSQAVIGFMFANVKNVFLSNCSLFALKWFENRPEKKTYATF